MVSHPEVQELQPYNAVENMPRKSKYSAYRGIFLTLISALVYSGVAVIVKQLKNIHPGQLAAYRYLALTLFSFPEAVKTEENLGGPKDLRLLLMLRAIAASSTTFFNYMAYRYLPLGESSAIVSSSPIFVTIAARIFLKERYGRIQLLTVLVSVVGIVFITKVPQKLVERSVTYTTESIYGFVSAALSLFCSASFYIVTRKLKSVHHSIQMLSFGWIGVLEMVVLTAIFGNFHLQNCGVQGVYIIALCMFGYINQTLVIMSLQCEIASLVSTIKTSANIGLAFLWQVVLFNEVSDVYTSLGAVLILISGILIGTYKWLSSLPEESQYRKKFRWVIK